MRLKSVPYVAFKQKLAKGEHGMWVGDGVVVGTDGQNYDSYTALACVVR